MARPTVIIAGAGFSGSLLAVHLLAAPDGPRVILAERAQAFARGCAYSTRSSLHRLNVRASNMSAFPDDPGHFVRWLSERHGGEVSGDAFVERGMYGGYLQDILKAAAGAPLEAGRLVLTQDEVSEARPDADGVTVLFGMGRRQRADHLVLATGPGPTAPPPGLRPEGLSPEVYQNDPWSEHPSPPIDAEVLLLGTGLTMVDVALALAADDRVGRITAISRRGLTPRPHTPAQPKPPAPDPALSPDALALLRHVRSLAREIGWRGAVDSLRPATSSLWRAASDVERGRFVRHLRPWWDVHRHRMAPAAAERLHALTQEGRLRVVAGRVTETRSTRAGAEVTWRARASGVEEALAVGRIINCTGPGGVATQSDDSLIGRLLSAGLVRSDRLGWGLDVTEAGQIIAADGSVQRRLHALGPLTRGAFLESTAVPDLRNMAQALARALRQAQPVLA